MRWDNLFDDLEGQLEHELSAEEVDLHAEEERLRLGRLSMRDRIHSLHDHHGRDENYAIKVILLSGDVVNLRAATFGRDWFSADLLDGSGKPTPCIVPLLGVAGLILSRDQVALSLDLAPGEPSTRSLAARLSLPFVLRDLCRRRSAVELRTTLGALSGTIDRVGRDHLDLAVHERHEPRRESTVVHHRVVPLTQLELVKL
ncbi:MAG: hypothetical protein ACOH1T_02190 [Microbacteriaceae bacterium]